MGTSLGKNYVRTKKKIHKSSRSATSSPRTSTILPSPVPDLQHHHQQPTSAIHLSQSLPNTNHLDMPSTYASLPDFYSSVLPSSPGRHSLQIASTTSLGYDSYVLPSPRSNQGCKDIPSLLLPTLNYSSPRSSPSSPRHSSPRNSVPRRRAPSCSPQPVFSSSSPSRYSQRISAQFPSLPPDDFTLRTLQVNVDQDDDMGSLAASSRSSSTSSSARTVDSPLDFSALGYSDPIYRNRPRGRSISDSMLGISIDNLRDSSISEIAKAKEREKKKNRRFEEMTKVIAEKNVVIDVLDLTFVGGKIGEGAFSEVWEGYWHGIHVAVKKLKLMSDDSLFEERFLREVESLRKGNHQNVVMFFGVCLKPPCIVTEYMAGGNLYDLLHKSCAKLSSSEVIKMACDLAVGLHHLHSLSILHRDLTSLNILLDEMGNVKISDFGLSREKGQEGSMTMTLGGICNPRWRPPEITKNLGHYSEKMDVYCFSLVVWEMLTGEIPFSELDGSQAAAQVAYTGLRPKIPPTCPEPLRNLITQCWVDDPNQRPDFASIVDALKEMQWNAQAVTSSTDTLMNSYSTPTKLDTPAMGPI